MKSRMSTKYQIRNKTVKKRTITMSKEIEIDKSKGEALLKKIVALEKINLKTQQKSDAQMILDIQKEIEEVVQCYSNP